MQNLGFSYKFAVQETMVMKISNLMYLYSRVKYLQINNWGMHYYARFDHACMNSKLLYYIIIHYRDAD